MRRAHLPQKMVGTLRFAYPTISGVMPGLRRQSILLERSAFPVMDARVKRMTIEPYFVNNAKAPFQSSGGGFSW
jgi:hypothetical protein